MEHAILQKLDAIEKRLEKLDALAGVANKLEGQIWIIEKLGKLMQSTIGARFLIDEEPQKLIT